MSSDIPVSDDNVLPEDSDKMTPEEFSKLVQEDFNESMLDQADGMFGCTVFPVRNRNQTRVGPKFEYGEHCLIGDSIKLTLENGEKVAADKHQLRLNYMLNLTYGQITGLAGDFYGTYFPICEGSNDEKRIERFKDAYSMLAKPDDRTAAEARKIVDLLREEVKVVNEAIEKREDPSVAYSNLPSINTTLQNLTFHRPFGAPSYAILAAGNLDHFGEDARIAYNAGHAAAIQEAINGYLGTAYAMNAFADHFLQDSFSAGHLRVPRRALLTDLLAQWYAKCMHDEDNAIGLSVKNPRGDEWKMYGDKSALDRKANRNKELCVDAVQASADEIYEAYLTKQPPAKYKVWDIAPTLESARGPQELAPLFRMANGGKLERRKNINNRREWVFTSNPLYLKWTAVTLFKNSKWNYPITLD